jgi:hypothetical protein
VGVRILCGADSDHCTGNLRLHPILDSGCTRGHAAHAWPLSASNGVPIRRSSALDVLGIRCRRCTPCAHQESYRDCFSRHDHFCILAAHERSKKVPEDASGFQHTPFSVRSGALAHSLGNPQSGSAVRPGARFRWFYFIDEQLLRYIDKRIPRDYDKVPLLLIWALLIVWLIPWFVFLFPALKQILVRRRAWRDNLGPHMQDLTVQGFGLFRTPLLLVGLGLLFGTGCNSDFLSQRCPGLCESFSRRDDGRGAPLRASRIRHVLSGAHFQNHGSANSGRTTARRYAEATEICGLAHFPLARRTLSLTKRRSPANGRVPIGYSFTEDYMKDAALHDIDLASPHLFAQQGGKFVFTNRQGMRPQ